jgi:polyisoprenyl-phosphate glycosyltransferase
MGKKKLTELSIITAVYNDAESVEYFYSRLKAVLDEMEGLSSYEIIFINDGSTDNSLKQLLKLKEKDRRVNIISLSRNFGYQNALQAGLRSVQSDLYSIIDIDCEDPPELLKDFYDAIKSESISLAYGIRSKRNEPTWITFLRGMFYKINKLIADTQVILWMAEFSMFTDSVKKAILAPNTTYLFLRTEMSNVGFKKKGFNYTREARKFGKTHYNLWKMTVFAVGGFLASSTFPLRMLVYLSVFSGILFFILYIFSIFSLSVLSSIASILTFFFMIISIPILAMYLARVYKNGIAAPLYIIDAENTFVSDNLKLKDDLF